jgi:VanZ family protein
MKISDKVVHFIMFGFMAPLMLLGLTPLSSRMRFKLGIAIAVVLCLCIGTEVGQLFIKGRSFEFLDIIANIGGGIFFGGAHLVVLFKLDRRSTAEEEALIPSEAVDP